VPSSLDADLATLFIPVSNGLSWVRSAGRLSPGESAAVIGVGQHGLACVAAARRCGSGTLVAVGRAGDQARLDAAVKLGADVIVDADREDWVAAVLAATDGLGADLLVDTAPGATDILAGAVRCGAVRCGAVRCGAVRCGRRPGTPSRSAASTTAGPTGTTVSWSGSRTRDGIAPMSGNVWACSPCPGWRATAA
jgi:threonine dehydrogenase-like Zn-dependent dehydrogenase